MTVLAAGNWNTNAELILDCLELGYVSNKGDREHLVSESWRNRTVAVMSEAIDAFLAKRLVSAGSK